MTVEQKFQTVSLEAVKSYLEDVLGHKNLESDLFVDILNPNICWLFLHDLGSKGHHEGIGAGYAYGQPWFMDITTGNKIELGDIAAVIHLETLDGVTLQGLSGEYGNRIDMERLQDEKEMEQLVSKLDVPNAPIRLEAIEEGRILVYGKPLISPEATSYLKTYGVTIPTTGNGTIN